MTRVLVALAVTVALSAGWPPAARAAAGAFLRAEEPWPWDLPKDHRAHEEFALEWWYLTGHLTLQGGRRIGYQATFFRNGLVPPSLAPERTSPFAATQALMWHGAVTDLAAGTHAHDETLSRAAAGWAHASTRELDVAVGERRLRQVAPDRWELRAVAGGWLLELDYALDRLPVLHGTLPGMSFKGTEPGQATYYVSRVHVKTSGFVTPPRGARTPVTGLSWFDQEFGTSQLGESQVGWDWFSVNLEDGSALMAYMLREKDGAVSPTSSGTWVRPDGTSEFLALPDIVLRQTAWWTSPRTGGTYPASWVIEVPRLELVLIVEPAVADQERGGRGTAGPAYWEGSCRFFGTRAGASISGSGYVELVGYAGGVLLR